MKYVIYIMLASVMLSGCAKQNSYYPRAYGEDWKVYPFEEGSATKVREQGRKC